MPSNMTSSNRHKLRVRASRIPLWFDVIFQALVSDLESIPFVSEVVSILYGLNSICVEFDFLGRETSFSANEAEIFHMNAIPLGYSFIEESVRLARLHGWMGYNVDDEVAR